MVRAPVLHTGGRRFESSSAHPPPAPARTHVQPHSPRRGSSASRASDLQSSQGEVAQPVERRSEKAEVTSSILVLTTIPTEAPPAKRCPRCGAIRPRAAFPANRRTGDGLGAYCRACNAERVRLRKVRNRAAGLCVDCGQATPAEGARVYCRVCADKYAARGTRWHRALRLEVVRYYGGQDPRCACCGEAALVFLTVDHMANDGAAHRRRAKSYVGMLRDLKTRGFPPGIQVLCFNCNLARGFYGACPHVSPTASPRLGVVEYEPLPAVAVSNRTRVRHDPASVVRRCVHCGVTRPVAEFYGDRGTVDQLQSWCKVCTRTAAAERLRRLRLEALTHYGGAPPRCTCCGEARLEFLAWTTSMLMALSSDAQQGPAAATSSSPGSSARATHPACRCSATTAMGPRAPAANARTLPARLRQRRRRGSSIGPSLSGWLTMGQARRGSAWSPDAQVARLAAGDGGQDPHLGAGWDGSGEAGGVADVVGAGEHVDVWTYHALLVEGRVVHTGVG